MTFLLTKASEDRAYPVEIEITTLEQLLELMTKYDKDIVIYKPNSEFFNWTTWGISDDEDDSAFYENRGYEICIYDSRIEE